MGRTIETITAECESIAFDLRYSHAIQWKLAQPGRFLAAYLPIYAPRELFHAMGGLAVGIMGTGDRMQIIKGDAFYQSYICHLPRGVVELAMGGYVEPFDAFLFPSTCDVIRNLSGMFQLVQPGAFIKYVDYPQNFDGSIGGLFYRRELQSIVDGIAQRTGATLTAERLNTAIALHNENRDLTERIVNLRQEFPWRFSAVDWYHVMRAGLAMPVEEHNEILRELYELLQTERGQPMDNIRVVISGAFCEQPPIGLIKTIELAGCYIIDDDFFQGSRWIDGSIPANTDDPLGALVDAYLHHSTFSSAVYDADNPKGDRLLELVHRRRADGVIFAAPGFCDPALLDRPELQKSMDRAGVRTIAFQYTENTGQFKVIKEQVGAFSDSIKLWEPETA